ncbi:unnamed protein product [Spirodela intermedia]|uniref:C2 domain-containing protein n=1 Tax=Spirodela intermedia TaxID=51605 RepID=A0A7I8K3X3_SPIIN|nr:unnamed protein product [Spirodela intermedia]
MEILDITVLSAEKLSLGQRPIKKNAFVALRTDSQNQATTALRADGGSYPHWNQRLTLAMPPSSRSVTVEVRCKTGADVRTLGRVTIPAADFHGGLLPAGYLHFLSYRLRDPHGNHNGIINLSVRVRPAPPPPPPPPPALPWAGAGVALPSLAANWESMK